MEIYAKFKTTQEYLDACLYKEYPDHTFPTHLSHKLTRIEGELMWVLEEGVTKGQIVDRDFQYFYIEQLEYGHLKGQVVAFPRTLWCIKFEPQDLEGTGLDSYLEELT